MDKESIYLLQKIDCNCNDCFYMERDFTTYGKWEEFHRKLQLEDFEQKRVEALKIANECQDELGKKTLLDKANKMRFLFNKNNLLNYGNCKKFNKQVSFLSGVCQIETQKCFIHRKDK